MIRLLVVLALAAPLAGGAEPLRPQAAVQEEDKVRASMLLQFARKVVWPKAAFPHPNDPMVLGVLGTAESGAAIEKTLAGHKVGDRPLKVVTSEKLANLGKPHLLFAFDADLPGSGLQALQAFKGSPVLVVTDAPGFTTKDGGMVRLFYKEFGAIRKIRFGINLKAVASEGLDSSALIPFADPDDSLLGK